MLTDATIKKLPWRVTELYRQAEDDIIRSMAARIAVADMYIPATQWQHQKLQELGMVSDEIISRLSSLTGKSNAALRDIIRQSAAESLLNDGLVRRGRNGRVVLSARSVKVMNATMQRCSHWLENLTRTTAQTATQQFEQALDRAYMQVVTGGFTRDEAVRMAVDDLAKKGIQSIKYPSGHTDSLEVAVRRAVVTATNQNAIIVSMNEAIEMGFEIMELTAHAGARPSHAEWQGKKVRIAGQRRADETYLTLSDIGFGTGDGFGGWNCRHSWHPYWEGAPDAYSDELLKEYTARNVTYNGKKLTEYEAQQEQRKIERAIRQQKRRVIALQAAGMPTDEPAALLKKWKNIEADFLKQTGFKAQPNRSYVAGSKAATNKKTATKFRFAPSTEEQRVAALRFDSRYDADKLYRPTTEALWPKLTPEERRAAWDYTAGSGKFNRPMRGYDKSWSKYKGVGNVPLNNEGAEHEIYALQRAIDKADTIKTDTWLYRGSDRQSLTGLLRCEESALNDVAALKSNYIGALVEDNAFFSTGIAADAGFSGEIKYRIFAPANTKGIYAEPFSRYGKTDKEGTWDGAKKGYDVGDEAEIILQSGTIFRVLDIRPRRYGNIEVILEVVHQK